MNHARRIYLSTYFRIDAVDHLIKNARLFYRTWKHWHAPVNHALALTIAVAYDMYLECCEGEIEEEWKINHPVSYYEFQNILSVQMIRYSPRRQMYPGDDKMRIVTSMPKKHRGRHDEVSLAQFRKLRVQGAVEILTN